MPVASRSIVNPYDEWYALVRALELKEAPLAQVQSPRSPWGPPIRKPRSEKGLAIGADEAVRVDVQPTEALQVAEQVAAYAKDKGFDLTSRLRGQDRIRSRQHGVAK